MLSYAGKETASYFTLRHSRSTNTVSRQQPVPSLLIWRSGSFRSPVHSRLVNWHPWSGWKMVGVP